MGLNMVISAHSSTYEMIHLLGLELGSVIVTKSLKLTLNMGEMLSTGSKQSKAVVLLCVMPV